MKPTESIQQTMENIRAWAGHYGLPLPPPIATMSYKNIFPWTEELRAALWARLSKDYQGATPERTYFSVDPFPVHSSHRIPGLEVTGKRSYRENCARWSVQIVEHCTDAGGAAFEIDIDEENPNCGGAPGIMHGLRTLKRRLFGGSTNPFAARKGLLCRGIKVPLVD